MYVDWRLNAGDPRSSPGGSSKFGFGGTGGTNCCDDIDARAESFQAVPADITDGEEPLGVIVTPFAASSDPH